MKPGTAALRSCSACRVTAARRWSSDPTRELGATFLPFFDEDMDPTKARKWALMLLAGPGAAGQPLPS